MRAGTFGAADDCTRGGVVTMDSGRLTGGDYNLAYAGNYALCETSIVGRMRVFVHGDPDFVSVFGSREREYHFDFVGEMLSSGHCECRLMVDAEQQGRLVLRRLMNLPERRYEWPASAVSTIPHQGTPEGG